MLYDRTARLRRDEGYLLPDTAPFVTISRILVSAALISIYPYSMSILSVSLVSCIRKVSHLRLRRHVADAEAVRASREAPVGDERHLP